MITHFVVTHVLGNGNGKQGVLVDAMRFRPNIVVYGSTPYNEDNWKRLHIGDAYFTVSAFSPLDPIVRGNFDQSCASLVTRHCIVIPRCASNIKAKLTAGHIC